MMTLKEYTKCGQRLDGTSLNLQKVDMTDEQIEIEGIAQKNMLGIDNKTLMQSNNILTMVYAWLLDFDKAVNS